MINLYPADNLSVNKEHQAAYWYLNPFAENMTVLAKK